MITFTGFLEDAIGNMYLPLVVTMGAIALKAYLLVSTVRHHPESPTARTSRFFLCFVLSALLVEDLSWATYFCRELELWNLDYRIVRFIIRVAWAANAVRFQALSLFIESLAQRTFVPSRRQKIFMAISGIFMCLFISIAFIDIQCSGPQARPWLELFLQRSQALYFAAFFMPLSIFFTLRAMRHTRLPRILHKQLRIILTVLIIPDVIIELIHAFPNELPLTWIPNNLLVVTLSIIILTTLMLYGAHKMVGLRFLNASKHVHSPAHFSFVNNFQEVLGHLSQATTLQELMHISQQLFHKAFHIPVHATALYICSDQKEEPSQSCPSNTLTNTAIDRTLAHQKEYLQEWLQEHKLLMYDEIAFNDFYDQDARTAHIIAFLDAIGADIFIPIFNQQKIIAYLVVERHARPDLFYSRIERDEMLVFAGYIGNIINLMQKRNLESMLIKEKEMMEEIYYKHQEIRQYKESIRSFLRHNQQRKIGIIFYKNRKFVYGNREAKDLIPVNLNTHDGHPLTRACKQVVHEAQSYKIAQSCFANDQQGVPLVISGVPHLEQNTIILMVYYPEISDVIAKQIDLLRDPTNWDYVLYLETTKVGRLINQLVPGSGENLLQFKIELLKTALSTKATLLEMPAEDILPTVELLHHISMRSILHTITLEKPDTDHSVAISIFGISQLFGAQAGNETEPLLKRLHNEGTLFIQNIHLLGLEAQAHLAEFIRHGYFRVLKSNQKIFSNVRIICSSNQNLGMRAQDGKFSPELLKELQKTSLSLPSFMALPEQEIEALSHGFAQQALATHTFDGLLEIGKKDHQKIIASRPTSLHEIKKRVQQILQQKSKTNCLDEDTFDPAYEISDPQLVEIARLGKNALKDAKALAVLLNKFKSQNKVASFLKVNRSSVFRRCKDFNLK